MTSSNKAGPRGDKLPYGKAAKLFATKVGWLDRRLNGTIAVTTEDLQRWDADLDDLITLADEDYGRCSYDEQRLSVMAVIVSAFAIRTGLKGQKSVVLMNLADFLTNGACGRPTALGLPNKLGGGANRINDLQAEIFYAVLHAAYPDHRVTINVTASKVFKLSSDQLRFKRRDLQKARKHSDHIDRMFDYAVDEIDRLKSTSLTDYI
jgi:hypothetical protein